MAWPGPGKPRGMRTGHQEKERKFDGAGEAAFPALEGIPGVAQITDAEAEDLDAVYYDTADLRLLARGVTLRRRTGGHDAGWHLKLPVGPDLRNEVQVPLGAGGPGRVPRELVLRTRAFARGGTLGPVVHLRSHRRRRLLLDDRGRTLAEIAHDTVSAQLLGTQAAAPGTAGADAAGPARPPDQPLVPAQRGSEQSGARRRSGGASRSGAGTVVTGWSEVEAELVEGRTALLDAVERRFAEVGLLRSASPSKLARALTRPSTANPTGPAAATDSAATVPMDGTGTAGGRSGGPETRPGSIGAAVAALLREQSAELLAIDPAVRADEPDAVHRMRVAVRRLRSTLRIHRRLLADGPVAGLADELRHLGTVLGAARDQEVLGELLGAQIARLAPEEVPGPVAERVAAWSAAGYRRSWKQACSTLDTPRYYAVLDAVETLSARPPLRGRARRAAVPEFERLARREQKRVDRRIAEAGATPLGPDRDEALHDARKAAKRARYASEGAVPVVGKPAARFARRMKAVQELLGDRQDALLACTALPGLAATAHRAGEEGFGYGVLFAGQRAAIARVDYELPTVWKAACDRRLSRFR